MKQALWVLCIFNIVFSAGLYISRGRNAVESDNIGIMLAALAVMITLFIGWQIYNAIEIYKAIERSERKQRIIKAEIMREMSAKEAEIKTSISDLKEEFSVTLNRMMESVFLRYQDCEVQMVVNAIFNIHTYPKYEDLRDNSISLLDGLLPDMIIVSDNDNKEKREHKVKLKTRICNAIELEHLDSVLRALNSPSINIDIDRGRLMVAIRILYGHKKP